MANSFNCIRRLGSVLCVMLSFTLLNGQEQGLTPDREDAFFPDSVLSVDHSQAVLKTPVLKKINFAVNTGIIAGKIGKNNAFAAAYLAPSVFMNVSPKLRVNAGLIYLNSFSGLSNAEALSFMPGNQLAVFASADYFINHRLTLTGSVYKRLDIDQSGQTDRPQVYNRYMAAYRMPSQSMSLGVTYRITKGLTIGAEIRYTDQYPEGFYTNPYRQPVSPFFW